MRFAIISLLALSLPVSAQQDPTRTKRSVSVTGVLIDGPCPGAVVLRADSGNRYELDRTRVSARAGLRMTVQGDVYPRVSVCKSAPWLDVHSPSSVSPTIRPAGAETPQPGQADLSGATVILVSRLAELDQGLARARALAGRLPASLSVAVGVPGSPSALLTQLDAVTKGNRDLMSDVHVLALPDDTSSPILLRRDELDMPFSSIDALLATLDAHVASNR